MHIDQLISRNSSRFVRIPFAKFAELVSGRVGSPDLRGLVDAQGGAITIDRIEEIAAHLIQPKELESLRSSRNPAIADEYLEARSAIAALSIDWLVALLDHESERHFTGLRQFLLFIAHPLFRHLVLLQAILRATRATRWMFPFLQFFARRLDKSSRKRRSGDRPQDVSSTPPEEPSSNDEESGDDEPPLFGCTASEALQTEVLGNLPSDLARLFFLASLFDREAGCYVDHSRMERFGVEATERAALEAHKEMFRRLTHGRLEDLGRQLLAWADSEPEGFRTVMDDWRVNRTYRFLTPPTAEQSDKELFEENFRLAMIRIANEIRGRSKTRGPRGD